MRIYVEILNFKTMLIPFTYLGLPVGANRRIVEVWEPMIRKLKGKRNSWGNKHLSFGEIV